jgi:uridine kinase
MPPDGGPERARVVDQLVTIVNSVGDRRVRVAIDGLTAAGKTSLGHELGRGLVALGRTTLRASLDDFKRPWCEAHRYDRVSGEGYYRNAFEYDAVRRLLLDPSDPNGDGRVALCSIDTLTPVDHSTETTEMPASSVLVVDGVFACRPELNSFWDLRIWVAIDPELSVLRGTARDAAAEGGAAEAEQLHRDRYLASEVIYIGEADPLSVVDVIVDNTNFDHPQISRERNPGAG